MRNERWRWQPIGELFEIGAGKTMSVAARTGANAVPFLRTSNVLWDEIDLSTIDRMSISDEELRAKSLIAGDILVCEGGDVGRAAVWPGGVDPISFQNHLHRLRCLDGRMAPRFLVYFLQCAFTQLGLFEGAANDTTIPNLSRNRLSALEVPVPPPEEQLAIVKVLQWVRDALKLETRILETTERLKQVTMRELFTRGMRGAALKETEIGPLPLSWDVVALGSLGRIGNGSTPKKANARYWVGGTFPWLTSARVYDREVNSAEEFVTQAALDECHLPQLRPGSVLVAITGQGKTLGHCAVLRMHATINQHLAYLDTDLTTANPSFVRGYLETQYDYLRQVGSGGGSTKGALTCAFLRSLKVPLPLKSDGRPDLVEQDEIVAVLDAIDQNLELHKRKRVVLEELFKSLLHKLMTGEIRVSDLDLSALEQSTSPAALDAARATEAGHYEQAQA
jgi:type I restriction enzyme S subunit